ncbi:hypothetical protein CB0940_04061 [Cercospora beticola]|uniref:Tautomerase cis-CaaD-like domain-containing protein n=1 Tax=Cercospora beticola TaxID=122368 RepID=A0A2G5HMU1_CERBT|nr:hypothetical protein CB0940_04061 [Cercospora beticola]PIA93845.1 hypothetical protein CB0940_04061 [Cercospora beticola]WPB01272.1 hypothetical protein RHO25_005896 [Cercospora beticola]CAK1363962.1 unnamed protein product [Cercospora beticola]
MPHWRIFHPPDVFQDAHSKQSLAEAITNLYSDLGFPPFYVVVTFLPTPDENQFVGGQVSRLRGRPFIRLNIAHIHVNMPKDPKVHQDWTAKMDKALKPHIEDKGFSWEYHVEETERLLWKIDGVYAPEFRSEDEKVWMKENRVVRAEEMEEVRRRLERARL